jgi:hypothetical protein
MKKFFQQIMYFLLTVSFILSGCVNSPVKSNEKIDGLIIRNETKSVIEDVVIQVPKTGKMVSCSVILRLTECSLGFPVLENQNNNLVLSWKQKGRTYQYNIDNKDSNKINKDQLSKVIITIENGGHFTFRIGQE